MHLSFLNVVLAHRKYTSKIQITKGKITSLIKVFQKSCEWLLNHL
jgi:hypothetical protein